MMTLGPSSSGESGGVIFSTSINKVKSCSLVCLSIKSRIGANALSTASVTEIWSSENGTNELVYIFSKAGPMIAIVKNSAIPRITWFGGVCAVPRACLVMARTIAILVKHVELIIIAGIKIKTVISPMIFSAVVICPFAVAFALLGRFILTSGDVFCATAKVGNIATMASTVATIRSKDILEFSFIISL